MLSSYAGNVVVEINGEIVDGKYGYCRICANAGKGKPGLGSLLNTQTHGSSEHVKFVIDCSPKEFPEKYDKFFKSQPKPVSEAVSEPEAVKAKGEAKAVSEPETPVKTPVETPVETPVKTHEPKPASPASPTSSDASSSSCTDP